MKTSIVASDAEIHTYGLKNGIYSGRFQKVVTLDDLFAF